jgi:hypothetical protein
MQWHRSTGVPTVRLWLATYRLSAKSSRQSPKQIAGDLNSVAQLLLERILAGGITNSIAV